jgi:hypothetical protein
MACHIRQSFLPQEIVGKGYRLNQLATSSWNHWIVVGRLLLRGEGRNAVGPFVAQTLVAPTYWKSIILRISPPACKRLSKHVIHLELVNGFSEPFELEAWKDNSKARFNRHICNCGLTLWDGLIQVQVSRQNLCTHLQPSIQILRGQPIETCSERCKHLINLCAYTDSRLPTCTVVAGPQQKYHYTVRKRPIADTFDKSIFPVDGENPICMFCLIHPNSCACGWGSGRANSQKCSNFSMSASERHPLHQPQHLATTL